MQLTNNIFVTSGDMCLPVTYRLMANSFTGSGTSNISHLITDNCHQISLSKIDTAILTSVFGERCLSGAEPVRGYTDPDWYWKDSFGNMWGIGFRHGHPRLRGYVMKTCTHSMHSSFAHAFLEFVNFEISVGENNE